MKLTKEDVYVDLRGKTKEELTDLWEFLTSNWEECYRDKEYFLEYTEEKCYFGYDLENFCDIGAYNAKNKTEVTIKQLKDILQPMGTFAPIAMKCTQEQFEAIKPKLKGLKLWNIDSFSVFNYLTNNIGEKENVISNVMESSKGAYNRVVYEQWNEEIFLKACGIEVESLEQQLQKAEAEVKRLKEVIEEENKPKVGDWAKNTTFGTIFKLKEDQYYHGLEKITNSELIKLLEQEIK